MIIKNISRGTVISERAEIREGIFGKFLGLMFCFDTEKSLIFRFSHERLQLIHMLFVFHAIDVVFLDKENMVVEVKEGFFPFRFYNSRRKAMYVIEVPYGAVKNSAIKIGDRVGFERQKKKSLYL